jgi:hypothetical protein
MIRKIKLLAIRIFYVAENSKVSRCKNTEEGKLLAIGIFCVAESSKVSKFKNTEQDKLLALGYSA